MKIVLGDWGLEVTMLASLAELQDWREQHPSATELPDLLLTDYLLEDGVGVEAMKQLRQLDAELPIVMLTGSVPAEEGIRMTHDPHFLLLAKPISAAALRNSLTRMLLPDHQDTS
ncbi:MAG TPA: response regulator [Chromatiaceae bacterium]|nr:response regulator [Chromatiaceae bacterium]